MRRFECQLAYVLHTRPYRETSFLCEFFTADYGRISVVAKGVRRPKSRGRALLQPFIPLMISCVGRGSLLTLTDFDAVGVAPVLTGRCAVSAFYLNELLFRLIHHEDPNPDLFFCYQAALSELEKTTEVQIVLRLFEKSLLKMLGYELQLVKELRTGKPLNPEGDYRFDPASGPVLVETGDLAIGVKSQDVFKGKSLLALAAGVLNDIVVLGDLKRLMRLALAPHLGSKPLESRKLL
ncbi:MAG TPA: DNA repair protein RecO [Gammaproteobacteria bacterium]|nr:DNA repair protein RecO [Gammaproteobacteria bacterium]HRA42612.1 DNA repair protein RecO [Gammaproteobacteria bacterium]